MALLARDSRMLSVDRIPGGGMVELLALSEVLGGMALGAGLGLEL